MWYCFECEEYFDSPNEDREYHSELAGMGGITYESYCTCPMCGSAEVDEASAVCDLCGDTVIETTTVGNESVCPACYEQLKEDVQKAVDDIAKWFNTDKETAEDLIMGYFE